MYTSVSPSLSYIYLHIYCYCTSPPQILVGLSVAPYIYVRKRYFIMRAERSGHIFSVYALLVCYIQEGIDGENMSTTYFLRLCPLGMLYSFVTEETGPL